MNDVKLSHIYELNSAIKLTSFDYAQDPERSRMGSLRSVSLGFIYLLALYLKYKKTQAKSYEIIFLNIFFMYRKPYKGL